MAQPNLGSNIPSPKTGQAAKSPGVGLPKTVRIILEENDNIPPTGQFFGLNGKSFILKPGQEADVPQGLIDILNNAVQASPIVDPETRQVVGYRSSMRYPYRVINRPAASEGDDE